VAPGATGTPSYGSALLLEPHELRKSTHRPASAEGIAHTPLQTTGASPPVGFRSKDVRAGVLFVDGVQHAEAVEDGMTLSLQGSCHPIVERHRFRSTAERHDP